MGIGDWGLGIGPNPQSPIPNPHKQNKQYKQYKFLLYINYTNNYLYIKNRNYSMDNERIIPHKLVILGDVAVGKSSIAQR